MRRALVGFRNSDSGRCAANGPERKRSSRGRACKCEMYVRRRKQVAKPKCALEGAYGKEKKENENRTEQAAEWNIS